MKEKKKDKEVRIVENHFAEIRPVEGMKKEEVKLEEVFKEPQPKRKKPTPTRPGRVKGKTEPREVKPEKGTTEREKTLEKVKQEMVKKSKGIPIDKVETFIDRVMEMLERKDLVNMEEISEEMEVEPEQIMEWTKVLEDHGMVELVYPEKRGGGKMKKEIKEKVKQEMMKKSKELPIDRVETDIDKLMGMIERNESISIKDISKELKVDVAYIEEWAKILEEYDLIEITYPVVGLPVLRRKNGRKKRIKEERRG